MAAGSEADAHARMRQRIAVLGKGASGRGIFTRRGNHIVKDRLLRGLVKSGLITPDILEDAISGFLQAPSDFEWLIGVDDALLGRAGEAFFAKYGRHPVEDVDFRLNGDFYRICRSLQYDSHYYDSQLQESSSHSEASVAGADDVSHAVASQTPGQKQRWPFITVLILGFGSAPILAMAIATYLSGRNSMAGLLVSGFWLLILLGALVWTFPRKTD